MTRVLSQLLEAKEPDFRQAVNRMEQASGNACHDIRLTQSLQDESKLKISALGLDPNDTTGEELYEALQSKIKQDDRKLIKKLRTISATYVSAEGNVSEGIAYSLSAIQQNLGYGVKNVVAKKILAKNPPKKLMKALGYRSASSLLKHEPMPLIVTVALNYESASWCNKYKQALKKLSPRDCEDKPVAIYCMSEPRWQNIAQVLLSEIKQTVVSNGEMVSIVVLPLPSNEPRGGLTTASLALGLHALNSIMSSTSYLKLSQVSPNFGERLESLVHSEPEIGTSLLPAPLSWETVQRFLHHQEFSGTDLGVFLDQEELKGWRPVESMIQEIAPELEFWKNSGHLAVLDKFLPVSLNILDNALNLCNRRKFGKHVYHHAQRSLWQEFIARYIRPELLSEAINNELQPRLAAETVEI